MVNFRNITNKAKDVVEKRGGSESLKRDADELKSIARGPGTLSEKAKAAASALKDPGAAEKPGAERPGAGAGAAGGAATKPTPKQAAGRAKADAAKRTGTAPKAAAKRPPEESGGAK